MAELAREMVEKVAKQEMKRYLRLKVKLQVREQELADKETGSDTPAPNNNNSIYQPLKRTVVAT
ncbi:MAG: hypothetical protein INR73_24255 [Williamsia sp.]|nr:hypothetical protein [Williamsia sp.]